MVVKEFWWAGDDSKALKNLRWARPIHGQRSDIMSWLRTQEAVIERERSLPRGEHPADGNAEVGPVEDVDRG